MQVIHVVGPSGSRKTTTILKLIEQLRRERKEAVYFERASVQGILNNDRNMAVALMHQMDVIFLEYARRDEVRAEAGDLVMTLEYISDVTAVPGGSHAAA